MTSVAGILRRWGPSLLMIGAIFLFSSIPSREMPRFGSFDVLVKKGGHAFGYGLLAATFWHGFNWNRKLWWAALLLAVLYAVTDEFHQSFVPGRHPSAVDVAIDTTAAAISLAICALARKAHRRDNPESDDGVR
jgi:VanZ family protein